MNRLSLRLGVIASLVPCGARVCDIGTDHGYLGIELIKSLKAKSLIAADINEKPLANARKNFEKAGVTNALLRLSNGFENIEESEFDTAVIAGMGGKVIAGIIDRAGNKIKAACKLLILQPTTSPEALRKYLFNNGFEIAEELPIEENGKLYSVMKVCYKGEAVHYDDYKYFVGIITPHTEAGLNYLKKQLNRCEKCMKALEGKNTEIPEYEHFKMLYEGIKTYINSFSEK